MSVHGIKKNDQNVTLCGLDRFQFIDHHRLWERNISLKKEEITCSRCKDSLIK